MDDDEWNEELGAKDLGGFFFFGQEEKKKTAGWGKKR